VGHFLSPYGLGFSRFEENLWLVREECLTCNPLTSAYFTACVAHIIPIMDLKLPNLGEGADSGTVVNLFVKEGDQIAKEQPIIELENEKAVATIPSTGAGKVTKIFVRTGEKISVGQNILSFDPAGSEAPAKTEKPPSPERAPSEQTPRERTPAPSQEKIPEPKSGVIPAAAPSIRKLARDLGIDLSRVRGSERGGRIELADLRAYIEHLQRGVGQPTPVAPAKSAQPAPKPESIDFSKWGPVSKKPLSPLRQVISRRMTESWTTVPRVTQFDEADITGMSELRKKYAPIYEQKGTRLTLTSFVLKAVVDTLKKHPLLNSSLEETTQELITKEYYHIGIAVDTEAGLIVPIIRDVDKKDMLTLSKELETLATKARERKVSAEELKGRVALLQFQIRAASAAVISRQSSINRRWRFSAWAAAQPNLWCVKIRSSLVSCCR
jgi:pyruvate dehydrogenase E2 component (dihydrolipoamide acetyltransferase)